MITPEVLKSFGDYIEKVAYNLPSSKQQLNRATNKGAIRAGLGAVVGGTIGMLSRRPGGIAAGSAIGGLIGGATMAPAMLRHGRAYGRERTMGKVAEKMSDVSYGSNVLQMGKKVKTKMPGKEKKPALVPTEV